MTIAAALRAIRQGAGPHHNPVNTTRGEESFLTCLIPEVELQNDGDDKEGVVETHASGTVPDAEGGLADEAPDVVSFHGVQQVPRSLRQSTSWTKELFVPERGDHRILTAHRRVDRG